ncbi:hypothetical protein FHL15_008233 [Xylaria flabelliformis]|uniref:Uncharacterized protein n=1 Tax=Xylaria flabelliformis TaxID=2512241 RepID=A0A553HS93_9PEZI|nr:hypothetical protein FHL15_008233 [Xylaria flabelliformis]
MSQASLLDDCDDRKMRILGSGTRLCPQQSNSDYAPLWWHHIINAQDANNITSTSYDPTAVPRRNIEKNLNSKVSRASCDGKKKPPLKCDESSCSGYNAPNYSRRTSTATSYRHRNSGVAKRQERAFTTKPMPLRPRISDTGNVDTHTAISQASTTDSAADSVRSCEQDSSSTALSLLSDLNHGAIPPCVFHDNTAPTDSDANINTAAQVSVSQEGDSYLANEAPFSEQVEHDFESGDSATSCLSSCEQLAGLSPLLHHDTEFRANFLAAPKDSRHLFLEYYKRTHGGQVIEAESQSEVYWKWDPERQQWFHKDPNTQSVMWFLG